jgi:hypothetical protein
MAKEESEHVGLNTLHSCNVVLDDIGVKYYGQCFPSYYGILGYDTVFSGKCRRSILFPPTLKMETECFSRTLITFHLEYLRLAQSV